MAADFFLFLSFEEDLPLEEDLAALAADHDVEALLEVVEMEAVGDDRTEVEATEEHLLHLIPRLPHTAAGDALDSEGIEDDIRPVDLRIRRQDTELGDIGALIHVRNHIIKGRRCAGHLKAHIEAADAELMHSLLDGFALAAIDREGGTHTFCYIQTEGIDIRNDDILSSRKTAYTCGHRTNESRAGDEHILTQQWESQRCMGGVAEGIHDSSEVVRYLGAQFDDVGLGDSDVLRKAAVLAHDTNRDSVLTDVSHTTTAVAAMAADDVSLGRDAFAYMYATHTGTYFYDLSHELVAHGIRGAAVGLGPFIPFIHMQVGAADGGFLDLDEDIVDTYFRHGNIFHPDAGLGVAFN